MPLLAYSCADIDPSMSEHRDEGETRLVHLRELAKAAGIAQDAPWPEICANAEVTKAVLADLQSVVKGKLSKFEIPTKCILIDDEFSVENDMMTAVRKLKRKPIADKHAQQNAKVYT